MGKLKSKITLLALCPALLCTCDLAVNDETIAKEMGRIFELILPEK